MIGKLMGHGQVTTTARYTYLARYSIKASSARIADSIGADLLERKRGRDRRARLTVRPQRPAGWAA